MEQNKYFEKKEEDGTYLSLSAMNGKDFTDKSFPNAIGLCIRAMVANYDPGKKIGEVFILLDEEEQNDLIGGILERRGWKWEWLEDREFGVIAELVESGDAPISPTGNEKSKICSPIE